MSAWTILRRPGADTSAASQQVPAPVRIEAGPGGRQAAAAAASSDILSPAARMTRRLIITGIIIAFLIVPLATTASNHPTARNLAGLGVALIFVPLVIWVAVAPGPPSAAAETPWPWLVVIVALAIAATAITENGTWVTGLAVAAAACGRFCRTVRPAAFGAISCSLGGLAVGLAQHATQGGLAAMLLTPVPGAFFAYSAGKRNEAVAILRATQAELARVAVAEERLRIARDLHDLLGHSLSLITLKAELSRRLIDTDAGRARAELGDLESVARQSLSDVREAVAGYRQPDLASELVAAGELLAAAGIDCQLAAPDVILLPGEADAVLAWTVREGITNVVRHSCATRVTISVAARATAAVVEITNDGVAAGPDLPDPADHADQAGPPVRARQAPACPSGSGLAGLRERVEALGGGMAAGPSRPAGFRLRVSIPVGGLTGRPPAQLAGS